MTETLGTEQKADRVILLYREAMGANLADSYRRGSLVELPGEGDLLVLGDLHGNQQNFSKTLATAELASHPKRHLILQEVIHGGPTSPSGADLSYRLLEAVAAVKVRYPDRVHVILGNHDLAEYADHTIFKDGISLGEQFHQGLTEAYGDRAAELREAMKRFIASFPLACRTRFGILISHSTPDRQALDDFLPQVFDLPRLGGELHRGSPTYSLVWGRDFSADAADEFARISGCEIFIVSHTPCPGGYDLPSHRHVLITSHTEEGCYVLLPLDRELTQEEVVPFVKRLHG